MNQNPSHSQTPEFGHTPTIGMLRQQPPSTKQIAKANRRAKVKAWLQDTIAVVVLLGTIGTVPFMVKNCSEDVDRQTLQAVKFQMETR